MNCPNCQVKMDVITAQSHYKANVFVDQCPVCGGLWFEYTEMYQVEETTAALIDRVDIKKLKVPAQLRPELFCPQDNTPLQIFSDPNFPDSLKFESCPKCGGFFFNRGEFQSFADNRQERVRQMADKKDDKFSEQIEKLLSLDSSTASYNMVGQVGKFLSRCYYPDAFGRIVPEKSFASLATNRDDNANQIASGLAFIIMQLLRLFLRR